MQEDNQLEIPEVQDSPESTESLTEESPESKENLETSSETEGEEEPEVESEAEEAPASFKYKVDGKEIEFPKELQSLANEDNSSVLRGLLEKAHGIEAIKSRHEEVKTERDQVKQAYQRVVGEVAPAIQARDSGDLDSFFRLARVTPDQVAEWMLGKIERAKLPKEVQQVYNEKDAAHQRLAHLESQFQGLTQEREQSLLQARSNELGTILNSESVKSIAEDFDSRAGKAGSFELAVIEYAYARFLATNKDLTPDEAVKGYLNQRYLMTGLSSAEAKPAKASSRANRVIAAPKPTVIPNVGNTSVSPTAQKPRSVADLRKIAKEMNG